MERNFESLKPKETKAGIEFQIKNLKESLQSLDNRRQQEENNATRKSLDIQYDIKQEQLEEMERKWRDWEERKDGGGHA